MSPRVLSGAHRIILLSLLCLALAPALATSQELGGAGTIQGVVKDQTGAVMVATTVTIANPVSGFRREATTDQAGRFVFRNVPPNPYHLEVTAQGFDTLAKDVSAGSAVPVDLTLTLELAGAASSVQVVGHVTDLVEQDPTAHTDIDQSLIDRLPIESSSGLNQVITLASPGVVADANGFFHPIGDHAQTQFSIDNQPITDQQSRIYSNQLSPDAVQSMEVITGIPPAEFGDKNSLVVRITTKSGLDQAKPTGSITTSYGSFKSPTADVNIGFGSARVGEFLSFSGLRTARFLDPPEFQAVHDQGSSQSLFNRLDFHPTISDSLHLNIQAARSSFEVPNTLDQAGAGQDQHQTIDTLNVAPGYSRVISERSLMTLNAYARRDHVVYDPSADPFADLPGSVSQDRRLTNIGGKLDFAYVHGHHTFKFGGVVSRTTLDEAFSLGLTDPSINPPSSPDFDAGLAAFDLSRGGAPFQFAGTATIAQQAFYVQDDIKAGNVALKLGLRGDRYDGLSSKSLLQPRLGVSYGLGGGGTVLRASYGRTLETPYNENLVLASSDAAAVLGTGGSPLQPGTRDQMEVGVQQALGRWLVVDVGYFYKHTTNGYDFGALFDTPIFFPVAWDHSKIDGLTARINLLQHGGFSAFTVLGHTNAIFSPPGTGGILLEAPPGDFRIDHDQVFQQTTNVDYVFNKAFGAWAALSWRYDSGLVAGAVPDYATALGLTADQQAAIGLFCGSTVATRDSPIASCDVADRGARRLVIPADGTQDDVTNPARVAPRHLFDLGVGLDNVLRTDKAKLQLRFSAVNLTNREALYNFLSTFSGTHFVTPRAYQVHLGVTF